MQLVENICSVKLTRLVAFATIGGQLPCLRWGLVHHCAVRAYGKKGWDMDAILRQVAQGFHGLPVTNDARQTASRHIAQWLTETPGLPYRPQLEWLIAQQQWSLLLDSFYQVLPFGTGGRRGPVGIGTNRFNVWTLASSVQGHVMYLRERYPHQDIAVVIAYDVRMFNDLRGLYTRDLPNPLLGMTSHAFAEVAAGVYT